MRAVGVVLQPHAEMADLVGRLDEGAADIVVADDAELERDARLPRHSRSPPARRSRAPARPRRPSTGALARQLGADALARLVDADAFDRRCRAGRNRCTRRCRSAGGCAANGCSAVHAAVVDHDDLARLDVAHELGADDVERAGLRGEDRRRRRAGRAPAAARPADRARRSPCPASAPPANRRPRPAQRVDQPVDDAVAAGWSRSGG